MFFAVFSQAAGALAQSAAGAAAAAAAPAPAGAPPAAPKVAAFSQIFSEAAPKIDLRLRMERARQGETANFDVAPTLGNRSLEPSTSWTARMRLGLLSGEYLGFQGFVELEHTEAWDSDRYNAAPGAHGDTLGPFVPPTTPPSLKKNRVVVADPETNELNQAWLSYTTPIGRFKVGRQRITHDEHRFIGNVGWRQNEQTYDGFVYEAKPANNLDLFYAWIYNVNRIFGSHQDDSPEASTLADPSRGIRDLDSRSHLLLATYKASELATLRGYAYLLDLQQSHVDSGSANTVGANLTGSAALGGLKLAYRAEYAVQTEAADAPVDYRANYYHFKGAGTFWGVTLGAGREVLGDDENARNALTGLRTPVGFATPLATLHAFNGYADLFLITPGNGLVDDYLFTNIALPAKVALELSFHKYRSNSGGVDYGREIDFVLRKPLPWNMTAAFKLASYRAREVDPNPVAARRVAPFRDTLRVIGQLEYKLN